MAKKILCKNCDTEISKDDKKCFNCGELNPTLKSCVVEGIISGVLTSYLIQELLVNCKPSNNRRNYYN